MTEPLGSPAESSLLQAASKNIDHLQHAVGDLQKAATEAKVDARAARKASADAKEEATRWKLLTRVLGFFVILALVASCLSVYNWVKAVDATNQLRSQATATCQRGNLTRMREVAIWDDFVGILLTGDTKPADLAIGAKFEAHIASVLAPRDCT